MELLFITLFAGALFVLGVHEKRAHNRNLSHIPLRINVNGIRGKSTATRLITALLAHNGVRTIGKTTGTSARMILPDHSEVPVKRRPQGPNIGEQRTVVAEAAQADVQTLVCECMAVNPDYQIVFQEEYLQAHIGVIVNVLEDHMDVMGPTLDDVADAFLATIPHNGVLVTVPGPYVSKFRREAHKRGSHVVIAPVDDVTEDMLRAFDYVIFPENIALAPAVADVLEIPRDHAFTALTKANPDPGATMIHPYQTGSAHGVFVNGFAVNDAQSTISMFERVALGANQDSPPMYIMNCRPDRVDRTTQFARDVFPH